MRDSHLVRERTGKTLKEESGLDRLVGGLYNHAPGRILLRPLVSPALTGFAGKILDSGVSRILIRPFIKSSGISMREYEKREYGSFNDFFTRKLIPGARDIRREPEIFISPCDSRLSVYRIEEDKRFFIKNTPYTLGSLLRNRRLASAFRGGYIWVFRLCVDDYHRYIFVDGGETNKIVRIPGIFHTVNPIANDRYPVYKENTREYALLRSENFGKVLQMEVGAMLVGKIVNHRGNRTVSRGQEKGYFAYGGSTVILITEKGAVRPDRDILKNSRENIETRVRMGERVGVSGFVREFSEESTPIFHSPGKQGVKE